ncbi:MAG: response regulator transcription factor [Crocinitomicaceae bacterium]|nr:response regulator transcription factor [Crocinitomicaceae bacterium]
MLLNTLILDDDKVFSDIMEHYVSKVKFLHHLGTYKTTSDLINSGKLDETDLLFLDIELPMMNGLEFLEMMGDKAPAVIIISSKKEYGVEAFEYDVLDYLHKPVSFSRFMKSANRASTILKKELLSKPHNDHFFIRTDGLWIRMPFEDVSLVKGDNNQVIIKTKNERINSPMRLKDIMEKLPKTKFMQVHRSYIIHLDKITKVDGEVIVVDNKTVPVSKTYIKELYERLNIERK